MATLALALTQRYYAVAMQEPLLVSYMTAAILNHKTLEHAVAFNMAAKLATPSLIGTQIQALFKQCFEVRTHTPHHTPHPCPATLG